jgi:tetratricopeptide (TPR) repeat protein
LRRPNLTWIAAALLATACAVSPPPSPSPSAGEQRFLIDPRTGYGTGAPEPVERRFVNAWQRFQTGDTAQARRRLSDLASSVPDYQPAQLALAALDIREGNLSTAGAIVSRLLQQRPHWTAARVYQAEIAMAQNRTREAYELYRAITALPEPLPTAQERSALLERRLFEELYVGAQTAPPDESIRMLHEALMLNPGSPEARILLGQRLVAQKSWDEAQEAIDTLVNSAVSDRPELQELLAEIDAGRGRFQDAITRYERLARATRDPRYARRLEDIKELWNAANMPLQFQAALESEALTRGDFAVLLYWKVPSVRFAQGLATPPIAIDVDVPGREEIIRAIAIGLYEVDPVTRRVNPGRPITAASLSRLGARTLALRGAACARGVPTDRILESCGIPDPVTTLGSDVPATGRDAAALLNRVDEKLH